MPDGDDGPGARPARARVVALVVLVTLAVGIGVVIQRGNRATRVDRPLTAATVKPSATGKPLTPFETAELELTAQAAALTAGDERAWMAAVDDPNAELIAATADRADLRIDVAAHDLRGG